MKAAIGLLLLTWYCSKSVDRRNLFYSSIERLESTPEAQKNFIKEGRLKIFPGFQEDFGLAKVKC
ncbi:hypothetical protein OESDEN_22258 [Oesophagostomum dentatum]|uniref:Uncharacterized protein n=1 Tax=Oesophagostomum dentatum TaxID=61180 RepID=A0A0B1S3U6_OESDE|nr:hypothetical protein OESDEN_22258 [Oesophagostomum dentatum]